MHLRTYMFGIGTTVLVALYMDSAHVLFGVAALVILEGITGLKLRRIGNPRGSPCALDAVAQGPLRIPFEAERMWQITTGTVLALSYGVFPDTLWFVPWFIGFAVAGAGLSGVCPVLVMLKSAGFR